jgi:tetratricopeptide (TPR) repeat protein
MMTRKGPAVWALLFALTISLSAFGQGRRNQQQQQQQQQPPQAQAQQQGVGPVPQSSDEADAFNALSKEQAPDRKVQLADAFIGKFPNSDFVQYAQMFRLSALGAMGNHKEAVVAGERAIEATIKFGEKLLAKADADAKLTDKEKENIRRKDKNAVFLDKNSPQFVAFMDNAEARILAFYQSIVQSYQQLNDAAKVVEWGEKALGFRPDDLNTLMMVSNVMAERPPSNDAQRTPHMKRAEELAGQALEALPKFLSSPGATNLPATAKAELTSQLHYTLGLIYLHQKRLASSQQEFLTALKAKPTDPITYFRLGIAYVQDAKNDQAMEALGKSVFLKGVSEAGARDLLKQLWINKNKSEQGLEDYVSASGKKIGQ